MQGFLQKLKKAPGVLLCWGLFVLLLVGCGKEPAPLRIAAASNLRYVLPKIAQEFTETTGTECELIFSSSGKLTAQIKAGAPYDLFLSADERYPAELHRVGQTEGEPVVYARGQLALWQIGNMFPFLGELNVPDIEKIALPNPMTAPYGRAAVEALRSVGLADSVRGKLVYGESVAQASQFVYAGAADVGFTTVSFLNHPNADIDLPFSWLPVDTAAYTPIYQSVVVMKGGDATQQEAARAFQHYLLSPRGQYILTWHGYLRVP
ncbi:MAG: molybdate ABC transporter substrate-binding protein [Bacteroidota bacterium]